MKMTEHLMFLALMIPTFTLIVVAVLLLAQPAHPSNVVQQPAMTAVLTHPPVDERGYDATY